MCEIILVSILLVLNFFGLSLYFYQLGKEAPITFHWRGVPKGNYILTEDFDNDRIVIKDVYGNEVIIFKRVEK